MVIRSLILKFLNDMSAIFIVMKISFFFSKWQHIITYGVGIANRTALFGFVQKIEKGLDL